MNEKLRRFVYKRSTTSSLLRVVDLFLSLFTVDDAKSTRERGAIRTTRTCVSPTIYVSAAAYCVKVLETIDFEEKSHAE